MTVKVKPLVWETFDVWTQWAKCAVGTYRVQERTGVWKAVLDRKDNTDLIYEYTTDGLTPDDFEAAQIAAQADYEARILAAIEAPVQEPDETAALRAKLAEVERERDEALKAEAVYRRKNHKLTADRDEERKLSDDLIAIVEGIDGAMNHGTWRDDKGTRLKDTPQWVAFYISERRKPVVGKGCIHTTPCTCGETK